MRILFQESGETHEQVRARIRAMIASGKARESDRFVWFYWLSPAAEEADN